MTAAPTDRTVRTVREAEAGIGVPLHVHPDWVERWPWLIQGTTWRGPEGEFDLGLSGGQPVGPALELWRQLGRALGCRSIVHSRQVHRAEIARHRHAEPGLLVQDGFDGHNTAVEGLVLTVSVADCVPVSIVDPDTRVVVLVHAGWRGVAAGIVERGISMAADGAEGDTARLHVHFGPAICGQCYEVGPEVHEQLGLEVPARARPVDLRAIAAARAEQAGVRASTITVSSLCTRCAPGRPHFSHRAGEAGRQMAVLGIRPD